jgi:hypothetical protein
MLYRQYHNQGATVDLTATTGNTDSAALNPNATGLYFCVQNADDADMDQCIIHLTSDSEATSTTYTALPTNSIHLTRTNSIDGHSFLLPFGGHTYAYMDNQSGITAVVYITEFM